MYVLCVHCVVLTCEIKVTVSDSLEHGFILVLFRFVEGGEAAEKDVCDNAKCPHVHLLPITRTTLLPRHVQNLRCNIPERRGVNVWERERRDRSGQERRSTEWVTSTLLPAYITTHTHYGPNPNTCLSTGVPLSPPYYCHQRT